MRRKSGGGFKRIVKLASQMFREAGACGGHNKVEEIKKRLFESFYLWSELHSVVNYSPRFLPHLNFNNIPALPAFPSGGNYVEIVNP